MAQVAAKAGVHPTTVSLAMRNHPSIPPTTRQRIQAIAGELGYRPDPALSALAAYRHAKLPRRILSIAYLTGWDSEWGWKKDSTQARYYAGAEQRATELGFKLEHLWLGEPKLSQRRVSDILYARGITGVIVASLEPRSSIPLSLDWPRFSGVQIDPFPHRPVLPFVMCGHRAVLRLAMRKVTAAQHRRIALAVSEENDRRADFAWTGAFVAEQRRLPAADRIPILTFSETRSQAGICARLLAWLEQHRPTVLLSPDRQVAGCLKKLGIETPRRLSFVDLCLEEPGAVAGVRHNCERAGAIAVEQLVHQIHENITGLPECDVATLVDGTWHDGPTLAQAPVPADDRTARRVRHTA